MKKHKIRSSIPKRPAHQLEMNLEEIEGKIWGEPPYDSHLVKTCYALRKKPLNQFQIEDLRILIAQHMYLDILVPLALEHLYVEPFAAGDYYEGDLLMSVLQAESFWCQNPEVKVHFVRFLSSLQHINSYFNKHQRAVFVAFLQNESKK